MTRTTLLEPVAAAQAGWELSELVKARHRGPHAGSQRAHCMASASAGALALEGNLAAVEELLAQQGDGVVNVADEDGRTMLHWASSGAQHPLS
eukprot:COSAG06_NODE_5660_length_3336_cov_3.981464_4_plen_93_part_00